MDGGERERTHRPLGLGLRLSVSGGGSSGLLLAIDRVLGARSPTGSGSLLGPDLLLLGLRGLGQLDGELAAVDV